MVVACPRRYSFYSRKWEAVGGKAYGKWIPNNTEVFLASPKIIDEPVYQLKFLR